jgi:hypothetical protein
MGALLHNMLILIPNKIAGSNNLSKKGAHFKAQILADFNKTLL